MSVGTGPKRRDVEFPDRGGDPGAVVVDQDSDVLGGVMAGEVDLADGVRRQRVEVCVRIEAEVLSADVDVVDITQEPAARPASDLREEDRLGNCRMPEAQVRGWILDEKPAAEHFLRLDNVPAEEIEALLGVGQRQQVVEINSADRAPRQVLGDEHRLDTLDQRLEAGEMAPVERLGAAER